MPITQHFDQAGPGWGGEKSGTSYFDFVVAERPKYIPNSGPPLAPISGMPIHDKDAIILEKVESYGAPFFYLVGYEAKPQLRVGVKPQNILDWVSPRTFENFELEISRLRDTKRRKSTDSEGQNQRRKNVSTTKPSQSTKPTTGKKRKRQTLDDRTPRPRPTRSESVPLVAAIAGPTRRRKPVADQPLFASPTTSHKSKGPSLTTPVKGLMAVGMMDFGGMDEELYDTDAAIVDQLNAMGHLSSSRNESSRSTTTTPMPPHTSRAIPEPSSKFESLPSRPGARASFHPNSKQKQTGNDSSFFNKDAGARVSSREASNAIERLERKSKQSQSKSGKKPEGQTIARRYSNFRPGPTMLSKSDIRSHFTPGTFASKGGLGSEEEEGEDLENENEGDEWAVDDILDDAILEGKQYYLVKWVGDWDNTWEPAENMSEDVIQEYDKKKIATGRAVRLDGDENIPGPRRDGGGHRTTKENQVNGSSRSGTDKDELGDDPIFGSRKQHHSGITGRVLQDQNTEEDLLLDSDNQLRDIAKQEEHRETEQKAPGQVVTSDCTDDLDGF
ncbi:uncharacterized protein BP5553_00022 [Venustampulla echinocandica]|uniref:Chromo domain-containing protein n=1 Tax=Venustampulla echinocandica TaxID=2656787 RepID=A0A370TWZ7_9HELO|nr:uncharacterized protein BP5553_00022 [Venustampulla echinocandica]RDL40043.1 hypothetical protein BP5553_00022 [Venustampulla echinocandica]